MIVLNASSQQHGMAKCETERTKRISYTFKISHIIHENTLNNDPFIDRMPNVEKRFGFDFSKRIDETARFHHIILRTFFYFHFMSPERRL